MFLEAVWSVLPEGRWESAKALEEASGLDEATLRRYVDFLVRWDFVETRHFLELQVRRKAGTISPVEVVSLLRSVTTSQPGLLIPSGRVRLAERIACRACGNRTLSFLSENEVECTRCHERQWFAIEVGEKNPGSKKVSSSARPNLLKRLLVRLGLPESTFVRNIPKPTRFYWFRCMTCKKVSSDYAHGFARYFVYEFCGNHNRFH